MISIKYVKEKEYSQYEEELSSIIVKHTSQGVIKASVTKHIDDNAIPIITYYKYSVYFKQVGMDKRTFIQLKSKTFSINFFTALVDYYTRIIDRLISNNVDINHISFKTIYGLYKINRYISSNHIDENNNFLEENKNNDFTDKMIIKYLLYYCNVKDEQTIIEASKTVNAVLEKNDLTNKDIKTLLSPMLYNFTDNELRFIDSKQLFDSIILEDVIIKVKMLYKIYMLVYKKNDLIKTNQIRLKIKDIVTPQYNESDSLINFIKSFRLDEKTINYINNITLEDFYKIYYNHEIIRNCNADNFIRYSEMIINSPDMIVTDDDIQRSIELLKKHTIKPSAHCVAYFYPFMENYQNDNYYVLKVFTEYFSNLDDNIKFSIEEVKNLQKIILQPQEWLDSYYMTNWIFYNLYNLTDSNSIIVLLQDVFNHHIPITIEQWEGYFSNYNDYKDMPISWWLELV